MLPSRLWRQYGDNFSWQSRKVASITNTICVQKDGVYRLCSFASIVKKTVASRLRRCWAEPAVRARLHDGLFDILGLWTCLPKSPLRHRAEESSSLPYVRRRLSHSHLGPAWCGTTWIIGIVYVEIFFFFCACDSFYTASDVVDTMWIACATLVHIWLGWVGDVIHKKEKKPCQCDGQF